MNLLHGLKEDKIAKRHVTHLQIQLRAVLALYMHPEDLKMIWICQECDSHFIFTRR